MTTHAPRAFGLLCAHWFFACGALGIFYPYFALFLRENAELTSTQVGLVLALLPLIGMWAQPAFGLIADRTGARVTVLVLICLGSALGYLALGRALGLAEVVAATCLYALFGNALFALAASVTFGALTHVQRFGRIRVWGTLGYFVMVVAAPKLLDGLQAARGARAVTGGPSEPGLQWMFDIAAGFVVIAGVIALGLRSRSDSSQRAVRGDLKRLLALPAFVRALVFIAGAQLCLNGPMQLFPLYVRARGGDMTDVSHMWIVMLALEVPLVLRSEQLFERYGVPRVIAVATAVGGLRWLLCACVPSLSYALPLQAVHGLVVTGFNVGAALYVEQIVPPQMRATAQALLVMVGSSLGGALSNVLCGAAVDRVGIDPVFFACGAAALLWTLAGARLLRSERTLAAAEPGQS